jgi:hypothetical protein
MLSAWHHEALSARDFAVEAHYIWRRFIWNDTAPEFRPEADDEIRDRSNGSRLTDRRDSSAELLGSACVPDVELQIGV